MSWELIGLSFNQFVIALSQFNLAVFYSRKQEPIYFRHKLILFDILIIASTQQSNLRLHCA